MNVQEIVSRGTGSHFSPNELMFVVEQYIKEKKGVEVKLNILKGLNPRQRIGQFIYQQQITKLNDAFTKASEYFLCD